LTRRALATCSKPSSPGAAGRRSCRRRREHLYCALAAAFWRCGLRSRLLPGGERKWAGVARPPEGEKRGRPARPESARSRPGSGFFRPTARSHMLRKDKEAVVAEATRLLAATEALYLSDYRASRSPSSPSCAPSCATAARPSHVLKNTLARRAAADAGRDQIAPLLSGPTAVTFCGDDPVAPAKGAPSTSWRTHPQLVVRGRPAAGRDGRPRRRAGALGAAGRATCSSPRWSARWRLR